jgi:predicted RNase H-like HicB family nuclease
MKTQKFVIYLMEDEEGGFVAECPALPGCVSEGDTKDEAIANIRDAIKASLETRKAFNIVEPRITAVEIEVEV